MATSGSRDKNPFRPGGNLGTTDYYLLVDRDGPNKGRITIKTKTLQGNIQGTDGDRTIGFIPLENSFQPSTTANPDEIRFFATAAGQKLVKDKGIETVVNSGVSQQEATQLIRPNTATPGGIPTPPGDTQLDVSELEGLPLNARISADFEGPEGGFGSEDNLRYPSKLNPANQDCIKFKMETNEGRNINPVGGNILNPLGNRREGTKIEGTVTLPIQSGITDSNGVDWGGANLDAKDAYLASLALEGISSGPGLGNKVGDLLPRVLKDLKLASNDPNIRTAINTYLAQEAVGIQGLLSRSSGAILNPNLELLFNGPTLRSFTFTFRLSPRSREEAGNVRRIIRFFKQGMAVKIASQGVFLKSPNIFTIQYLSNDAQHKSLPRIKKCALLGCDVDYTPDGTYMTFNDEAKTMTSYQLSLRFSELEPIYNDQYKDISLDEIGF